MRTMKYFGLKLHHKNNIEQLLMVLQMLATLLVENGHARLFVFLLEYPH